MSSMTLLQMLRELEILVNFEVVPQGYCPGIHAQSQFSTTRRQIDNVRNESTYDRKVDTGSEK
jgi:hypothetical protein